MEIRKTMIANSSNGNPLTAMGEREYIYFKVKYNNFRDVSDEVDLVVRDKEEMEECECVLYLPQTYTDDGEETPLIISCHGAGGTVNAEKGTIGGLNYVYHCMDAGYAVLDVNGAAPHGCTMGCPEHIFALYKAYRYATRKYNLSHHVLVAGASMGGHVAMNFTNTFPSIVTAVGLIYPRLHIDSVEVDGHTCIGTFDKAKIRNGQTTREMVYEFYRFPKDGGFCERNTAGFNPHKSRSMVNEKGERVVFAPCPIKIWQGDADETVDPVFVKEYVESVRRSGSFIEFHLLKGVGHKISPIMREELLMWFNRFI